MTLVALNDFAKLISCQIHYFNKSPNIISTNICSYTVRDSNISVDEINVSSDGANIPSEGRPMFVKLREYFNIL